MNALLISTYELGHQPFNLASPAAHLLKAGHHVQCLDLAIENFNAGKIIAGIERKEFRGGTQFPRLEFLTPARHLLPPLSKYAALVIGGEYKLAGYVEASRDCAHTCRHCPITPVYDGRLRIVQSDVVLVDIAPRCNGHF